MQNFAGNRLKSLNVQNFLNFTKISLLTPKKYKKMPKSCIS